MPLYADLIYLRAPPVCRGRLQTIFFSKIASLWHYVATLPPLLMLEVSVKQLIGWKESWTHGVQPNGYISANYPAGSVSLSDLLVNESLGLHLNGYLSCWKCQWSNSLVDEHAAKQLYFHATYYAGSVSESNLYYARHFCIPWYCTYSQRLSCCSSKWMLWSLNVVMIRFR